MIKTMIFKEINKKAFDELSDLCSCKPFEDNPFFDYVDMHYNGSNLRGNLEINIRPGNSLVYEEFMEKLVEILLKH